MNTTKYRSKTSRFPFWTFYSLTFALFIVACHDEKSDTSSDPCSISFCDGNILRTCQPDGTYRETDCGERGCNLETLQCNQAETRCTANVCHGNKLVVCDKETGKTRETDCGEAGCNTQTLQCNQAETRCTANVCHGNKLVVCDKATGKTSETDCGTLGCDPQKAECFTKPEFVQVPASQNNTEGASCTKDFVQHCADNDVMITCGYAYDETNKTLADNLSVIHTKCSDQNTKSISYKCGIYQKNGINETACIADNDSDQCSTRGEYTRFCQAEYVDYFEEFIEQQYVVLCELFDDGKLHNFTEEIKYCSDICTETEDGCPVETCSIPSGKQYNDKCDGNVVKLCDKQQDGTYRYFASNCQADEDSYCYQDVESAWCDWN